MSAAVYEKIRRNPRFAEMVAKRSRFALTLSLIVLVMFYAFILVIAFSPALLAKPLWDGATTTIAIPIGAGMILFFWLLTGYYVYRANRDFDAMNAEIIKEAIK
jgi:cation/acetate symporter